MRKPARPFVTEYKSRKPAKSAALFDVSMMLDDLPSRDINDVDERPSDVGYDARYEEALRTADSVFGGARPAPSEAPIVAPETPQRTILSDLSYIDPVDERLATAALVKRGRKPGSKNKPRVATMTDAHPETRAVAPEPATTISAPVQPRTVVRRRSHVGFIKQLEARRSTKPGDKWKLKLSGR